MTALLWKEFRENVYKVATGLGVVLLLHLLRQLEDFNRGFEVGAWAVMVGGLCAAVLAMDAVAGERSRGTLEFLLVRPTTVTRVLAAKYLVGAAGLLLVVGAFWAMVYTTPMATTSGMGGRYAAQVLADVAWLPMVYAWYLPLLVVYTAVFAASAATDNPAEAAGAGGLAGLTVVLLLLLTYFLFPRFWYTSTAVSDLVSVSLDHNGDILRVALRGEAILERTLLAGALIAVGFAAAAVVVARYREFTLGRRALVVTAFVLVTALLTVPRLLPDGTRPIHPVGTVEVGARARGLVLRGDLAYVLGNGSLLAVDVSVPESPRIVAREAHEEGWSLTTPILLGDRLCAAGQRREPPADSLAILCFDLSDPRSPRAAGSLAVALEPLPEADEDPLTPGVVLYDRSARPPFVLRPVGEVLVLGTVGATRSSLTALTLGPDGQPKPAGELVLERFEDRSLSPQQHSFSMAAGRSHLYLGMHTGLQVVAVTASGGLALRGHLSLEGPVEHLRLGRRGVHVRGDTVWVDRLWPQETVEVDVSDPDRPRGVEVYRRAARYRHPYAEGFFYRVGQGVGLYDAGDLYARPVPTLALARDDDRWSTRAVVLRNGFGYALMDGVLAVFRLPARQGG